MTDSTPWLPPRGWYPDPGGSAAWRWWDGTRWTDDLHAYAAAATVPQAELTAEQELAGRFLRVGIPIYVAISVVGVISRILTTGYLHDVVTWFRTSLSHLSTPGYVPPRPPAQPLAVSLLTVPVLVGTVIMMVLFLIAQHKMASVGRALGVRSRFSPTWGVVIWFIPLVDLVLPVLVWHDLVPAGHPLRRQITRLWLAYLGSGVLGTLSVFAGISSFGLALSLSVLTLGLRLLVARMLPGIVNGVVANHAAAAGTSGHAATGAL